jgi:hypothetical protein
MLGQQRIPLLTGLKPPIKASALGFYKPKSYILTIKKTRYKYNICPLN